MKQRWVLAIGALTIWWLLGRPDASSHLEPIPPPAVSEQSQAVAQDVTPLVVEQPKAPPTKTVYVKGNKVALRASPAKKSAILDRLKTGQEVEMMAVKGDWTKVRDPVSRKEGWVSSRLLVDAPPDKTKKPVETAKKPPPKPSVTMPTISDAVIIQKIIAASLAIYSGNCPCPYNRDRAGRSCGRRSAYSRPGGASPMCFPGDVSKGMIEAMRMRQSN